MSVIEELQTAVAAVAERVGPSIVGIGRGTRGSGVVIADGKVLTNAHNLRGDEVTVTFADGRRTRGTVAGVDGDGDLAVIEVDTAGATPARVGRRRGPRPSAPPSSGPAPAHGGGTRVTFGLVSAVARAFRGPGGRRIDGSVEHTAPLAPGSSGGALVDADGQLVGLNTNRIGEGFYLALPADAALRARVDALAARRVADARPARRRRSRPSHVARRMRRSVGLPERDGVLVRGVEDGSPADGGRHRGRRPDRRGRRASRSPTPTTCSRRSARSSGPFEVKLVRGTEERTVTVG